MQRITALTGLGMLLIAASGCSVFGIATKDELDEAMRREAAQQRVLEDRLDAAQSRQETMREDLESLNARLEPQIAALNAEIDSVSARLDGVGERMAVASAEWSSLRTAMIADLDTLRRAYDRMQLDVVAVRTGIDTVTVHAERAELRSREALRVHYNNLVAERDRLLLRLQELDEHLQRLQSEDDGALQPAEREIGASAAPAGQRPGSPEEDAGVIEIRAVTPERAQTGHDSDRHP